MNVWVAGSTGEEKLPACFHCRISKKKKKGSVVQIIRSQSPRYSDYRHKATHLGRNSIIINIRGDKTESEGCEMLTLLTLFSIANFFLV